MLPLAIHTLFGIMLCITNAWKTMALAMQGFIMHALDTIVPEDLFHILSTVFVEGFFVNNFI